jgi:hypothetical protein
MLSNFLLQRFLSLVSTFDVRFRLGSIAFWIAAVSTCPCAAVSEIEDHSRPRPAGLGIRLDSDVSRLSAN